VGSEAAAELMLASTVALEDDLDHVFQVRPFAPP
jgi:hypothetical protein